jgi:hypothetical protein
VFVDGGLFEIVAPRPTASTEGAVEVAPLRAAVMVSAVFDDFVDPLGTAVEPVPVVELPDGVDAVSMLDVEVDGPPGPLSGDVAGPVVFKPSAVEGDPLGVSGVPPEICGVGVDPEPAVDEVGVVVVVVVPDEVVVVDPRLPPLADTEVDGDVWPIEAAEVVDDAPLPELTVDFVGDPELVVDAEAVDSLEGAELLDDEPVPVEPPALDEEEPPDADPVSALAMPEPLTSAAPMPSATAPVPSHLYGSGVCRAR